MTYTRKKDLDNAQRIYERMLAITDSMKDRSPLDFAKSSAKLADVYRRQGKLELAENHYRQGLEWVQNTIGKENAFVPKTMYGLDYSARGREEIQRCRTDVQRCFAAWLKPL